VLKNKSLVFLGVVVAAIGSGLGADIYQFLKAFDWSNRAVAWWTNPVLQIATLSLILPMTLFFLYYRRWRFSVDDPSISYVLMLGGIILAFVVPFGIAVFNGTPDAVIANLKESPFLQSLTFLFITIWIGKDVARVIVTGKTAGAGKEPPARRSLAQDLTA
jgi:hypothetical protein